MFMSLKVNFFSCGGIYIMCCVYDYFFTANKTGIKNKNKINYLKLDLNKNLDILTYKKKGSHAIQKTKVMSLRLCRQK